MTDASASVREERAAPRNVPRCASAGRSARQPGTGAWIRRGRVYGDDQSRADGDPGVAARDGLERDATADPRVARSLATGRARERLDARSIVGGLRLGEMRARDFPGPLAAAVLGVRAGHGADHRCREHRRDHDRGRNELGQQQQDDVDRDASATRRTVRSIWASGQRHRKTLTQSMDNRRDTLQPDQPT